MSASGEEYGEDAPARAASTAHRQRSPRELLDAIFASVREFSVGAVQSDDVTALVFRYDGRTEPCATGASWPPLLWFVLAFLVWNVRFDYGVRSPRQVLPQSARPLPARRRAPRRDGLCHARRHPRQRSRGDRACDPVHRRGPGACGHAIATSDRRRSDPADSRRLAIGRRPQVRLTWSTRSANLVICGICVIRIIRVIDAAGAPRSAAARRGTRRRPSAGSGR